VIKLSCVPLQLLEANAMLIPTIWPLPLPSVSLPTSLFTNQCITEHYIIWTNVSVKISRSNI
jgi:hypothetical protein